MNEIVKKAIFTIRNWLSKNSTIYQIAPNVSIINPQVAPSSLITQEKISKFGTAYTEWVEKNAELK